MRNEERREARRERGPSERVQRHWMLRAFQDVFALRVANGDPVAVKHAIERVQEIESKPLPERSKTEEERRAWLTALLETPLDGPPQG